MSGLIGAGDNFWAAMCFLASTLGFVLAHALVQAYYVKPHNVVAWWYLGFLFLACMAAGVALSGGLVVLLWHLSEKRRLEGGRRWDADGATSQSSPRSKQTSTGQSSTSLAALRTTRYGCRPNFEAELVAFAERAGDAADVGVLVCGPQGRQTSVARECRARNLKRGGDGAGKSRAVFHFNSHSFDL